MKRSELPLVAILAPDQMQPLDVVGPFEVFANVAPTLQFLERKPGGYRVEVLSAGGQREVAGMSGLGIVAHRSYREQRGPIDTLLVTAGRGMERAQIDPRLVSWIRAAAARSRRVASVCTGAFLLAEAGLLDGRRATTHWLACRRLKERYPDVRVESNPIYIRDGDVWTSAGVTAGMDLALAMVEDDFGAQTALAIARGLVLYLRRPGGQDQYSVALESQRTSRSDLRDLASWAVEHLRQDLSVEVLAERASMSPRNFARVFTRERGVTPAGWVERLRVEAARRQLEQSDEGVEGIAAKCGFSSAEILRRAFLRVLHVTPNSYRARFSRRAS